MPREVYVFAKPKKYGDALAEDDVQLIYWPEKALPKTIYKDKATLFPENADGPRYIMRSTEAFEPVLASRSLRDQDRHGQRRLQLRQAG